VIPKSGRRFSDKITHNEKRATMIFDYTLAALVTAGLFFYLTCALLRPERF